MDNTTVGTVIAAVISACAALAGILFGVAALARNRKKDTADNAGQEAALLVEIGHIKAGIEGINDKIEQMNKEHIELRIELTKLAGELERNKSDIKTASRKLDELAAKVNGGNK